ncbi:DNA integrity scanning protein DisA nucleotide-binding domain protein [Planctomycetota bacterium]
MTKEGGILDNVCIPERGVDCETLRKVIILAIEIAREGREGRKIGTMFVAGDSQRTLSLSKCLILDPLLNHPDEKKNIENSNMRETVKELSLLDGAFIVSNDGIVISACRYINASIEGFDLPLGLGSRHLAAASITKQTDAVAVAVSESSIVRVFDDGEIVSEIIPELWMMSRFSSHIASPFQEDSEDQVTVRSK